MDKNKKRIAENALKKIAMREGKPISEVRKEIHMALLVGMCSQDASVQACWKCIPHEGDIPTPEEVILFLAEGAKPRM